ncbi:MAG TPA: hypothetical protein VN699_01510 [Pirellulales bacterium]|nr:hypothetical protein [Pirellulales bacterium]
MDCIILLGVLLGVIMIGLHQNNEAKAERKRIDAMSPADRERYAVEEYEKLLVAQWGRSILQWYARTAD